MRRITFLLFFLIGGLLPDCRGGGLEVSVRFDKSVYRVGDQLKCSILFTNISSRPIRFLPIDVFVDAAELRFRSGNQPWVEHIVERGERYYDFEALSRKVTVLQPKETFTRQITATVLDLLPPDYREPRRGLFLEYGLSALRLPGFGRYTVVKRFEEHSNDFVTRYLPPGPPFWEGVVTSSPIEVDFKPRQELTN